MVRTGPGVQFLPVMFAFELRFGRFRTEVLNHGNRDVSDVLLHKCNCFWVTSLCWIVTRLTWIAVRFVSLNSKIR